MPSMMDHVADKSRVELVRLSRQYEFPDFVKQASPSANFEPQGVPSSAYADMRHNQFPCHTKASTWLSWLYYQEKHAEFHPKDRRHIEKLFGEFIEYWGIKAACDYVTKRWKELHKTAVSQLPDTDFAYVWLGDNGTKERHLRMTTRAEVKAAADHLHQYCDRFPYEVRYLMARKILHKAANMGAHVGNHREFLEQQAGLGVCEPADVVQMIRDRGKLTKNAELRSKFQSMADTVQKLPRKALQPEMLVKLASTVDMLDRQLGIAGKYSDGLPRPEAVIFKATFTKAASALTEHVATTTGRLYEKEGFSKVDPDALRSLWGDEFADLVTGTDGRVDPEKMAEQVATLPRPDAQLLDNLLSESGIAPVMRKAASVKQGLTPAEMMAWAQAYETANR